MKTNAYGVTQIVALIKSIPGADLEDQWRESNEILQRLQSYCNKNDKKCYLLYKFCTCICRMDSYTTLM